MPLREYDCPKCGTFEVLQKMNDTPLEHHEVCGAPVSRRVSLSSFALKGGGWHADGYAGSAGGGCTSGGCSGGACPLPD